MLLLKCLLSCACRLQNHSAIITVSCDCSVEGVKPAKWVRAEGRGHGRLGPHRTLSNGDIQATSCWLPCSTTSFHHPPQSACTTQPFPDCEGSRPQVPHTSTCCFHTDKRKTLHRNRLAGQTPFKHNYIQFLHSACTWHRWHHTGIVTSAPPPPPPCPPPSQSTDQSAQPDERRRQLSASNSQVHKGSSISHASKCECTRDGKDDDISPQKFYLTRNSSCRHWGDKIIKKKHRTSHRYPPPLPHPLPCFPHSSCTDHHTVVTTTIIGFAWQTSSGCLPPFSGCCATLSKRRWHARGCSLGGQERWCCPLWAGLCPACSPCWCHGSPAVRGVAAPTCPPRWSYSTQAFHYLPNVPTTCKHTSGIHLLRQVYVLPHWDSSCTLNLLFYPVY